MAVMLILPFLTISIGFWIGKGIIVLFLIAGISKCLSIARRPASNTKCVLGLMFLLLAFVINNMLIIWLKFTDSMLLKAIMLLSFLTLGILCVVFSILGLVEVSREKGRFIQGKSQAIWALILFAGFYGYSGFNFLKAYSDRDQNPVSLISDASVPGESVIFEDLNFQFSSPPPPWVRVDAKKINPASCLGYIRRIPEIYFFIINEKGGVDLGQTSEGIAELVKANLKSVMPVSRVLREGTTSYNGIEGIQIESDVTWQNKNLFFIQWAFSRNGYWLQLHAYGKIDDASLIREEAARMFSRFSIVNPDIVVYSDSFKPVGTFDSPRYGFRVNLDGTEWVEWEDLEEDFEEAVFGTLQGDDLAFVVVPICLLGEDPDLEGLIEAFLDTTSLSHPDKSNNAVAEINHGGLPGKRLDCSRTNNGNDCVYRLHVLKGNGNGYLLAAWTLKSRTDALALLEETLRKVEFYETPAPLDIVQISPRERNTHAAVMNSIGNYYYSNDRYGESLPYYNHALECNGEDSVYLTNALRAMSNQEHYQDALDYLALHLDRFSTDHTVASWRPYLQARLGLNEEALENYEQLFGEGYRDEEDFKDYLDLLNKNERVDEAISELERFLSDQEAPSLILELATLYDEKGDPGKAVHILKDAQKDKPFDSSIAYALDDIFYDAERYHDSIDICEQLLSHGYDSGYTYYRRGRSEYQIKWYRRAKDSFEEAHRRKPADEEIKDYLDHVSGMLGEGSNSMVKDPIEPVSIPESFIEGDDLRTPDTDGLNYSSLYQRRIMAISFERGKEYRSTSYRRVKVLDMKGVDLFSTFEIPFDPLYEAVYVNALKVFDSAGDLVGEGRVNDYYVVDDTSSGYAIQDKKLNIPVPGLRPGCTLELTWTLNRFGENKTFPFLEYGFSLRLPVFHNILYIQGDMNELKFNVANGPIMMKGYDGIYWDVKDPIIYRREPYLQVVQNFLPTVWVADATLNWKEECREYLEDISDRLEIQDETRTLSSSLCADKTTEAEKIAALSSYVQESLTYKAIEFGRRAQIPNPPAKVIQDKYGDCKDHALLLHQLLQCAGITSHLALVHTSDPVQREMPSLEQFNHMIVCIPSAQGDHFLDCTDKDSDPMVPIPYGLGGRVALVLDPDEPRLLRIPRFPEDSSMVHSTRTLILKDEKEAWLEESLELRGYQASYFRWNLKGEENAHRRSELQDQMGSSGIPVQLGDMQIQNLEANEKPLLIRTTYQISHWFQEIGMQRIAKLPCPWERFFLEAEYVKDRAFPFQIMYPLLLKSDVKVQAPEGWKIVEFEALSEKGQSKFAEWHLSSEALPDGVNIHFEFRMRSGRYPAEEYDNFRMTMEKALQALEGNLIFQKDRD